MAVTCKSSINLSIQFTCRTRSNEALALWLRLKRVDRVAEIAKMYFSGVVTQLYGDYTNRVHLMLRQAALNLFFIYIKVVLLRLRNNI